MLKDPPCLVLDEATSAVSSQTFYSIYSCRLFSYSFNLFLSFLSPQLDARSEWHINQALHTMTKGRTVISIAHRLSTIKESDRIAVLKGGRIAEVGNFNQLIDLKGVFYNLVSQQLTNS